MVNKGFTLVELLIVVVIIGIIGFLASSNVIGFLNSGDEEALESIRAQLDDAALSYTLSEYYLLKCDSETYDDSSNKDECSKSISVKDLIDDGYFVNKDDRCNVNSGIVVYKEYETNQLIVYKGGTHSSICS